MTGTDSQPYRSAKLLAASAIMRLQRALVIRPRHFCLVSGAPRSGTTAMIRWLIQQPGVSGMSESGILVAAHGYLQEVQRYHSLVKHQDELVRRVRRLTYQHYGGLRLILGRRLLVDKQPLHELSFPGPSYVEFLDDVRLLIPDAKFVLMIRDPIAAVWSMSQWLWGGSQTDLEPRAYPLGENVQNWCNCADVILRHTTDAEAYICRFGSLVAEPERESERIFRFLGIRKGRPFEPRSTAHIGFSDEEREKILVLSRPHLHALRAAGISDLG